MDFLKRICISGIYRHKNQIENSMKKIVLILSFLAVTASAANAQHFALKNNLLSDAALSPNLALEIGVSKHTSFDIYGSYRWFDVQDNKYLRHWYVQPEFRVWTCERFNGFFIGLHAIGGEFVVGGYDINIGRLSRWKDKGYDGYFYGGGLSIGYQWPIGTRWGFEMSVGGGYAYMKYHHFDLENCCRGTETLTYNYFGLTKAQISFAYYF